MQRQPNHPTPAQPAALPMPPTGAMHPALLHGQRNPLISGIIPPMTHPPSQPMPPLMPPIHPSLLIAPPLPPRPPTCSMTLSLKHSLSVSTISSV
eukprot:scaffold60504_cov49-Cyclotella_meneghiniana.AAC.1